MHHTPYLTKCNSSLSSKLEGKAYLIANKAKNNMKTFENFIFQSAEKLRLFQFENLTHKMKTFLSTFRSKGYHEMRDSGNNTAFYVHANESNDTGSYI